MEFNLAVYLAISKFNSSTKCFWLYGMYQLLNMMHALLLAQTNSFAHADTHKLHASTHTVCMYVCMDMRSNTHTYTQGRTPDLEWFPRLRCMSLNTEEAEPEQNEMKDLQRQLKDTTSLVKTLSFQLSDLREKVRIYRNSLSVFLMSQLKYIRDSVKFFLV